MEEKDLIKKAKDGNRASLEVLLKESYPIVFGYLMKLCRNEEIAKDITQDVMVKAIVSFKNFRGNSKFSTWLVSIAINQFKDINRKNQFFVAENIDNKMDQINNHHGNSIESAEDIFIKKNESAQIMSIIDDLPEAQKQTFILKHFYDFSYEEIAKVLKCPIGTVRSRLFNGIKKIREILSHDSEKLEKEELF